MADYSLLGLPDPSKMTIEEFEERCGALLEEFRTIQVRPFSPQRLARLNRSMDKRLAFENSGQDRLLADGKINPAYISHMGDDVSITDLITFLTEGQEEAELEGKLCLNLMRCKGKTPERVRQYCTMDKCGYQNCGYDPAREQRGRG